MLSSDILHCLPGFFPLRYSYMLYLILHRVLTELLISFSELLNEPHLRSEEGSTLLRAPLFQNFLHPDSGHQDLRTDEGYRVGHGQAAGGDWGKQERLHRPDYGDQEERKTGH